MTQQWHFEQDEHQRWHWRSVENAEESPTTFATAPECMLDAVRYAVERRRAEFDASVKKMLQ